MLFRSPGPAAAATAQGLRLPEGSRVLGIDPSLRGTGWGVIRVTTTGPSFLEAGTIRCPKTWERSRCLGQIQRILGEVLQRHPPALCACEGLFFAQNLKTAITMGEARGASLAMVAEAGLDIFEISPRAAKLAIVGFGGAQKLAVAKMVQRILGLEEPPEPDAADALALALSLAQGGSGFASRRMKPL